MFRLRHRPPQTIVQKPLHVKTGKLATHLNNGHENARQITVPPLNVRRWTIVTGRRNKLAQDLTTDPSFNTFVAMRRGLMGTFRRSSLALIFALLGDYVFWPFTPIAIVLILQGGFRKFGGQALRIFMKERRLDAGLITALSIAVTLLGGYVVFSAVISLVGLAAIFLNSRVKGDAQQELINVFKKQPLFVWRVENGEEVQVPFSTLREGDVITVNPGNIIPADGLVMEGIAAVDQHALTGESQPAEKEPGDKVLASTVVTSGKIFIQVERAGRDTTVAKIGEMLNKTLRQPTEMQLRADRIVSTTILPTLVLTVGMVPFLGVNGSIAFLLAHPRRRPSLFASITILSYFRILSENQIFVKDGPALDAVGDIDTIVFDKTGTLTITQPQLGAIHPVGDVDPLTVLSYAASAENRQSHPIALAILEAAEEHGVEVPEVGDMHYELGFGLDVRVGEHRVRVGSRRYMQRESIPVPEHIEHITDNALFEGHNVVMVALDEALIGALELVPTVREEAYETVALLKAWGVKDMYIISGDAEQPTRKLARDLGINHYYAETLPQQKAEIVQRLVDEGRQVCFVGDGINDAIAMQTAQVSISLKGASTVATDSAQVLLLSGTLRELPLLYSYGKNYGLYSRWLTYGLLGLGSVGMLGVLFPYAISFAFAVTLLSLFGGLVGSIAPYLAYNYRKQRYIQQWRGGETVTVSVHPQPPRRRMRQLAEGRNGSEPIAEHLHEEKAPA